ncbi:hypothetical protein [Streptomyces sp. NBC_00557]|uniref:hypothetical protein n=1 Tax=Streptomyces sp. NBC_00557 TaxID=2975776 RepID=UPI002E81B90A|nr:hypothetical protein [Streptomyces sp. NBC_00557]WUC39698.1 hypothetical protein OG956_38725 [Streptomyces sp. NBC_00557]
MSKKAPQYTKVELSGPPEAIARLMAALGEAGEIIFDHRSAPDTRGDVACTARVATLSAPQQPVQASGTAEVVVQSRLSVDAARWPGLGEPEGARRLEASTAAALAALDGVDAAEGRLVAVTWPSAAR